MAKDTTDAMTTASADWATDDFDQGKVCNVQNSQEILEEHDENTIAPQQEQLNLSPQ